MGKYFGTSKNGIEDKQTGTKRVKFFPIKTHQFINILYKYIDILPIVFVEHFFNINFYLVIGMKTNI